MVRPKRFELLTYRFVACCSIQLSYERPTAVNLGKTATNVKRFFAEERIFFNMPSKERAGRSFGTLSRDICGRTLTEQKT